MMKEEFDLYYWQTDLNTCASLVAHDPDVEISKVTSIEPYNVGQMLKKPNKFNQSDFSLFFIENIRLLVIILIGFILNLGVKFILLKLIKRRCSLYNLFVINGSRLCSISFKLGFLSLAFGIFLFLNLNILTNLIKTEKITVDTSEFIDSVSKLNRTTKPFVAVDAYSEELVYRLFKKRKNPQTLISSDYPNLDDFFSKILKNGIDSYFYFMAEAYFIYSVYCFMLNGSVDYIGFFKQTIYFESLKALLYKNKLDKKMKQILNRR